MLVPAQVVDQICQGVVGRVPRKTDHTAGHSVKALFHEADPLPCHFHPQDLDHYTEGVVQVMMDAVQQADTPLTEERLFNWHAAFQPKAAFLVRRHYYFSVYI